MVAAFSIYNKENSLKNRFGFWDIATSFLAIPIFIKITRFIRLRRNFITFLRNKFEALCVMLTTINEALEKDIHDIDPAKAQEILELHRKLKKHFISVRTKLSSLNFADDELLEAKNRECLDIIFDIEYVLQKQANINNKERKQNELSKLVADKKDAFKF